MEHKIRGHWRGNKVFGDIIPLGYDLLFWEVECVAMETQFPVTQLDRPWDLKKKKEFLDEEILPCDSKRCVVSSRGRDFRVEWIYCHHLQELQVILIKVGPDFVHCFLPARWLDSVGITSVSSRTATRLPHFWPCSRFNEATGNRPLNESISNWIGRKNETGSVNYHVNRHKRSQRPQEKKSPSGVWVSPNSKLQCMTDYKHVRGRKEWFCLDLVIFRRISVHVFVEMYSVYYLFNVWLM